MRDANGQRFWMLAEAAHWDGRDGVQWNASRRSLSLASRRLAPAPSEAEGDPAALLQSIPAARDAFGTWARWLARDETSKHSAVRAIVAGGAVPDDDEVPIAFTPGDAAPTDIALGYDGVLYAAGAWGIAMYDRRGRRRAEVVALQDFTPWRMAADPRGGVWALDGDTGAVARLTGGLWADRPYAPYAPGVFRPERENPDPPRLTRFPTADVPADERPAGIASSPGGRIAVLSWADDGRGVARVLDPEGVPSAPIRMHGGVHPYSLAWVSEERLAVMDPGSPEALVYAAEPGEALPVGDLYPLRGHRGQEPFAHGLSLPPHYPAETGFAPLHRLSFPSYARTGRARGAAPLDSRDARTAWHRLYLEAHIPPGASVTVWLAATDEPRRPEGADAWFPHRFGGAPRGDGTPAGAWLPYPSEVPFHGGLLACTPERGTSGLWTALVQRRGLRVSALRGRFLWVRLELEGSGSSGPEVAAVRAYASRFSYAENYLPELYRESVVGPEADQPGPATQADFLERFLGIFESVLTPLEDRVARAWLLTDARTAPAESLEWLAGWVGLALDPALSEDRRRAMLAAAPQLARSRGTLRGLALALDVATGGAVRGGEVVVVEDFRLRRTFATILGADLSGDEDPLLGGISVSGNSYVGDTLFLGEEENKEFLALFRADLPVTDEEEAAVDRLFERLAHRVTVLVHQEVEPQDLGLIARVLQREAPAHVLARVMAASHPLVVGLAALVGVDTYLTPRPAPGPVRVERSQLGLRDFLLHPVSLDPRLEGGSAPVQEVGGAGGGGLVLG
ncbi:MAG TPA: phage tail protein [Longimicrobium sp.]|jgi:phage tail-like protein|uniref:phage tail protein n=1 Tax=Longimicrobium sp. TaxID=2029185 RepID=UPI002ED9BA9E